MEGVPKPTPKGEIMVSQGVATDGSDNDLVIYSQEPEEQEQQEKISEPEMAAL